MTLVYFILILSVLIFVHEAGHFFVARRLGIGVDEFGFGFPPRLWSIRRGRTTLSLNAIPFGGFVRLTGEHPDDQASPNSFSAAPFWKKLFVLAAGVIMNAVLAWVLISAVLIVGVSSDLSHAPTDRYAQVTNVRTLAIVTGSGATAKSGIRTGDHVISVDGRQFSSSEQLIAYNKKNRYAPLTIAYTSSSGKHTVEVAPATVAGYSYPKFGFGIQKIGTVHYPWYVVPYYGLTTTASLTWQTVSGLGQLIKNMVVTGRVSEDLSGPIGIAVLTGEVRRLGIVSMIQFMALLSISLSVMNFIPFPALDGGRVAFVTIEKLTKRSINPRVENAIHATGFYVLIALLVAISVRDIQHFDVLSKIRQLFR